MFEVLHKADLFGPDGFPVVIARREPQPPFPLHSHRFAELVIVTGGSGIHAVRGERYPVSAGDVFVIQDRSPHEYRDLADLRLVNVLFDPHDLDMAKWDVRTLPGYSAMFILEPACRRHHRFSSRLRLDRRELTASMGIVDRLEAELAARAPGFRLMATALFMELVAYLSRRFEASPRDPSRALVRIGATISHIEEHYPERIRLDALARMAHMSPRNLARVFRQVTGMPPIDYLIHVRVVRAAELLRNSGLAVTEIAFSCGFEDSNYFARQFRREMDCTPLAYRRRFLS